MIEYMPFQKGMFPDINKNLAVVEFYTAAQQAKTNIKTAEMAFNSATSALSQHAVTIRDEMFHYASSAVSSSATAETKPALLTSAFERYKAAKSRGADEAVLRSIALEVLPLFATFDDTAFMAMSETALPIEGGNAAKTAVDSARTAISKAKFAFQKALSTYKTVFTDKAALFSLPAAQQPEAAYERAEAFVSAWRGRVKHHSTPVTVECTAIKTLPEAGGLRKLWHNAYAALFYNVTKSPSCYQARNYQE